MKISVIIACLNAQDTIENALASVFNQTYKDIELIVVDGASNDGTVEVINKYKEKISYFISEPDNGVYDAMNKGIKLSPGDFLIFLNADDVFYDNQVLEKVAKVLMENSEIEILFGDVEFISENGQSSRIQTYENVKSDFSFAFKNICHQCIFYHKDLFEKFGFYSEQFKIYADWDFNIRCITGLVKNKAKAVYLPIVISKFKLGGICSNQENRKICKRERNLLLKKYYPKFRFFRFLVFADNFFKKRFKIYTALKNTSFSQNFTKMFCSIEKHKLDIKTLK